MPSQLTTRYTQGPQETGNQFTHNFLTTISSPLCCPWDPGCHLQNRNRFLREHNPGVQRYLPKHAVFVHHSPGQSVIQHKLRMEQPAHNPPTSATLKIHQVVLSSTTKVWMEQPACKPPPSSTSRHVSLLGQTFTDGRKGART